MVLAAAVVAAPAAVYLAFEGDHCIIMIRFVFLVWIVPWEGSGNKGSR